MRLVTVMSVRAIAVILAFSAPSSAAEPERVEFTRLVAHWAEYADPCYLPFIEEAKPEVAQIGFYGAHFWSLAHTTHGQGYPAHFPVEGNKECGAWFKDMNDKLHERGVRVVGHFNVKFLVGDSAGQGDASAEPTGFFKFYRDLWDESLLGPRPVKDPLTLLEVDRAGKPISNNSYSIGGMKEYWACLLNPDWQVVLKAWTKYAIGQGVDGLVINYFYRHDCHCQHCVGGFKEYLRARFTAEELKEQFGIADLAGHEFAEIVSWHDPKESTPLKREMLRFSQLANKRAFDEVFVKYGRSLKPDLILAQWNHLGDFGQISGDERCLLPAEEWGRGEDYLWYSTGGAACYTDLKNGFLGEGTLQARYIRGAFDDKPFTLGKYESTRIRAAIAELAANGGAPMGFYTRFTDSEARKEIVRYYNFLRQHEAIYNSNLPHAEVLLLFPRSRVHAGDVAAVENFKQLGKKLLDEHVLFNVRPDDVVTEEELTGYAAVVRHDDDAGALMLPEVRSRFDCPATVRVSASILETGGLIRLRRTRPEEKEKLATGQGGPREITLHFVNYNRVEPPGERNPGGGIADEKPIATDGFSCELMLPQGSEVAQLIFLTPEQDGERELEFAGAGQGGVKFDVPGFLVYGVVRVKLAPR